MLTEADVRRRRLGGAVAAVVGALLLVLAVLAMTGKLGAVDASKGASDAAKSAGATSNATPSGDSGQSSSDGGQSDLKAPLTVLNASATTGLAHKAQTAFEGKGWEITSTGNLTGADVPDKSTVYYPAGDENAHVAAQNLVKDFPELVADEAPDGFEHDGVVVVLTGDWDPEG